jgi:hypothetical protein
VLRAIVALVKTSAIFLSSNHQGNTDYCFTDYCFTVSIRRDAESDHRGA